MWNGLPWNDFYDGNKTLPYLKATNYLSHCVETVASWDDPINFILQWLICFALQKHFFRLNLK